MGAPKGNQYAVGRANGYNPATRIARKLHEVLVTGLSPETLARHMNLLIKWIDDERLDIKLRCECMDRLHNRVLGKPRERIEMHVESDENAINVDNLSQEELNEWLRLTSKAVNDPKPVDEPLPKLLDAIQIHDVSNPDNTQAFTPQPDTTNP